MCFADSQAVYPKAWQNRSTVRSKRKSVVSSSDAAKAAPLVRQDSLVIGHYVSSFTFEVPSFKFSDNQKLEP